MAPQCDPMALAKQKSCCAASQHKSMTVVALLATIGGIAQLGSPSEACAAGGRHGSCPTHPERARRYNHQEKRAPTLLGLLVCSSAQNAEPAVIGAPPTMTPSCPSQQPSRLLTS